MPRFVCSLRAAALLVVPSLPAAAQSQLADACLELAAQTIWP